MHHVRTRSHPVIAALLAATFAGSVRAQLRWVDWTDYGPLAANGSFAGGPVALTTTRPGAFNGSILDGTSDMFSAAEYYAPALPRSDLLYILGGPGDGVRYSLTFAAPVRDVRLHLQSFASVATFPDALPVKLSGQSSLVTSEHTVRGVTLGPPPYPYSDSNGTILLPGTFTRIEFTVLYAPVDGIGLQVGGEPACPADFNVDGFLDFFDYDDYVNCFESGSCPAGETADFNGDGFADFFDYGDFVAAFEAGC